MSNFIGKKRILPFFGLGLEIVIICLIGLLFLREKVQYVFPADQLEHGAGIFIQDFNGEAGGFYIDNSMEYQDQVIASPPMSLRAGSYQLIIDYKSGADGQTYNLSCDNKDYRLITGRIDAGLSPRKQSETLTINTAGTLNNFQIRLSFNGNGYLLVRNITIQETNAWKRVLLFLTVLLFTVIDVVYFLWNKKVMKNLSCNNRKIIFGLVCITLLSSYPIFNYYLFKGHDLPFHLLRIEGIKDGLLAGQFPVKMQPNWQDGYGYAVAVFYGDIFLYFPAFLRLIGFSIQNSYKAYILAVNAVTCLSAFWCFKKVFKSDRIGLISSCLYTLSVYRLTCIYIRAAVGEYTALIFLPFVMYGLFTILTEEEEECKRGCTAAVIGYTGLIQTHILSCEMIGILTLLVCLILWKRVIRPKRFLALSWVVILSVLINLWFLVPFLDYIRGDFQVTGATEDKIQTFGAFVNQLLAVFPPGYGDGYSIAERMRTEAMPLTTGAALLMGAVIFVYYLVVYEKRRCKERTLGLLALWLSVVMLWMSTTSFPWDWLQSLGEPVKFLIQKLQFPWRFLSPATITLTVVSACLLALYQYKDSLTARKIETLLCVTAFAVCGWFLSSLVNTNETVYYGDESMLNTFYVISSEYIPAGTNMVKMENHSPEAGEGISLTDFHKMYTNVSFNCTNRASREQYIYIPLLYYKGYTAFDTDTGKNFPVSAGDNNRVQVVIPPGYSGNIQVRFLEPWYWRGAELVSLASVLICLFYMYKRRKK